MLLSKICKDDELRHDLHTGFSDAPNGFPTLFDEEVVNDFLIEEIFGDVFGKDASAVDDFLLDADSGLFVKPHEAVEKVGLNFLLLHVGSEFSDQLDRYDLVLFVCALLKLLSQKQELLLVLVLQLITHF